MSESRIQFEIVMCFRNEYPEYRGCLMEINNSTNKGASRLSAGMVPGASDLVLCSPDGLFGGFEIKEPNSRHNISHLLRQISWGEQIIKNGGLYFFVFSKLQFIKIFEILRRRPPRMYAMLRAESLSTIDHVKKIVEAGQKRGVRSVKLTEYEM